MRALHKACTDQRGVALPMAMLTLVMLTMMMLAFAVLSQTEPVIASNQFRTGQARSLADAGLEAAIWALTNGNNGTGAANSIPLPMVLAPPGAANSPAQAPWDGNTFFAAGTTGGFRVAVRNDQRTIGPNLPDANVREITAVGWTPDATVASNPHRQVFMRVLVLPSTSRNAPCALCVNGNLGVTGNSTIDGTNTDPTCGGNNKYGAMTAGTTTVSGSATNQIYGGACASSPCVAQNQGAAPFAKFSYSSANLDQLKALAKKNGTYFGPGYPNGGFTNNGSTTWTGIVTFNSGNQVGNGIIFVDTTDGVNLPPNGSSTATLASVGINGNPFTGVPPTGSTLPNVPTSSTPGTFTGAMVVNGNLAISGNMQMNGLVYVANDFTYAGTGTGGITGQVISQNYRDTTASTVDTTTGNSKITFNCAYAKGFNLPPSTTLIAGSYQEQHD